MPFWVLTMKLIPVRVIELSLFSAVGIGGINAKRFVATHH